MAKTNKFKRAIDAFRGVENRDISIAPTNSLGIPYGTVGTPLSVDNATQLSTVYRCVEVISDAIASEDWQVLEHTNKEGWKDTPFSKIYYMLNREPNIRYSRHMLMKTLVSRMLLWGNAFIKIHRNGIGDPTSLELITAEVRRFIKNDGTSYYEVGPVGANKLIYPDVREEDMIHVMNKTMDGLIGISVLQDAFSTLNLATYSEASAEGFFLSGANMNGIITVEGGKLTKEMAQGVKDSWRDAFNSGDRGTGGIAVLGGGLTFTPVNVNPRDAQMLETRKFNVIEICRFFGVSPSKVFDDANLTYSNVESFQLGFISDTVAPLNSKIEGEFNRKLLRPSKRLNTYLNLDIKSLLSYNLDAKANYVSKMFQSGGYTVNEVRADVGNKALEGGDDAYVQVNMKKINEPIIPKTINKAAPVVESNKKEDDE